MGLPELVFHLQQLQPSRFDPQGSSEAHFQLALLIRGGADLELHILLQQIDPVLDDALPQDQCIVGVVDLPQVGLQGFPGDTLGSLIDLFPVGTFAAGI